jgi:hypothetical protein
MFCLDGPPEDGMLNHSASPPRNRRFDLARLVLQMHCAICVLFSSLTSGCRSQGMGDSNSLSRGVCVHEIRSANILPCLFSSLIVRKKLLYFNDA